MSEQPTGPDLEAAHIEYITTNDVKAELLARLAEPTADKVRRDQVRGDVLLRDLGRTLAPLFNALLADVEKNLGRSKEPKP
jgi:hypothetical protein